MSKICTFDYQLFSFIPQNRPIEEWLVLRKMKMLKENNLFHLHPMIVTPSFGIIDGQHRFVAAQRLHLKVWFQVHEDWKLEDLISMNTNAQHWKLDSFINLHAHNGIKEYVALKKLCKMHGVTGDFITRSIINQGATGTRKFKDGACPAFDAREADELLKKRNLVIEMLTEKIGYKKLGGIKGALFARALITLLRSPYISFDTMLSKLEQNIGRLRSCTNVRDYIQMLVEIYNWKSRKLIVVDPIVSRRPITFHLEDR